MDGWVTDEQAGERGMDGWVDGWMDGCVGEWTMCCPKPSVLTSKLCPQS